MNNNSIIQESNLIMNKHDYLFYVDTQLNLSLFNLNKTLDTEVETKIKTLNEFKSKFLDYFKVLELYIREGKKQIEIYINKTFNKDFHELFEKENVLNSKYI